MKKIEYIWRQLLDSYLDRRQITWRQQGLARDFRLSSSTVNLALKPLRELGAVRVGKRGFEIVDWEKILYHWANHRRLAADILAQSRVDLPIREIEGQLPGDAIPTAYTAARELAGEPPAEYDKVYCYYPDPKKVLARFVHETTPGPANLFLLRPDPFLTSLSLSQLFVDLWGLSDWYTKDFVSLTRAKINDRLLS